MAPRYLSLFAGCGGFDLGFRDAGYRCVGAFEIDRAAIATFDANLAPFRATRGDLLAWRGIELPRRGVDVVIAGPPCQGFSTAGTRRGNDPRNRLLLVPVEIAIRVNAPVLIIENVPGALAGEVARYWRRAERRLTSAGYKCRTVELNSAAAGLPQVRRRMFLIANHYGDIPELRAASPEPPVLASVLNVPDGSLNHAPVSLVSGSIAAKIAAHIKPGQKLSNVRMADSAVHTWDIPEVFGPVPNEEREFLEAIVRLRRRERRRDWGDADPISRSRLHKEFGRRWLPLTQSLLRKGYLRRLPKGHYDLRHTFNGKYRRLDPRRPTNCVLTKFCQPRYFLHPYEDRAFSVREAARIQGFPDWFKFHGTQHEQARQVGNAVPPALGHLIGCWILQLL
jgi:DNA (cytosine-5)-methyltransferase 1